MTTMGHAALFIEAGETSLLVDPWLVGSCYWRSWWHFPPVGELRPEWLEPQFIYLTHHHFDHFHYPSLRRISKDATCLIPRFGVDVMRHELRGLGFNDVIELRSGEVTDVGRDLRVASFQYGFDDSAILITDGSTVVADMNDCKIRGRALQPLITTFGRPTFLLKNHSWAQAYPNRYTAEDPADLELLSRDDYAADFLQTVRAMRPRYAVPFASMVCFLHPETRSLNDAVITPIEIADAFAADPVEGTALQVMLPGDGWSSDTGFDLTDTDYFSTRERWLDKMVAEAEPALAKAAEEEAARPLHHEAFAAYFQAFLDALPVGIRFVLPRPIAFLVDGSPQPYWVLDFRHRRVLPMSAPPKDTAAVIRVPPGVLADAIDKRTVNLIHISMRLETHLQAGGVNVDLMFWGLLMMWELGYLPVRRLLTARTLDTAWRRRSELWSSFAVKLFHRGPLAARMTSNMMADADR